MSKRVKRVNAFFDVLGFIFMCPVYLSMLVIALFFNLFMRDETMGTIVDCLVTEPWNEVIRAYKTMVR